MRTQLVDQLVGTTMGKYEVKQSLGHGRLSAVFLAQHPAYPGPVALTLFFFPDPSSSHAHTQFLQRCRRETSKLTALRHEHILPLYDYGEFLVHPFIVTPYIVHGSLSDRLKQQGRFARKNMLSALQQIVAGLEYAHNKGVIHGMLQSSTLLLSDNQTMLVAGFGLMNMLQMYGIGEQSVADNHLVSVAGTLLANPAYVAPEVMQGQPPDIRSDVYSLGIVLCPDMPQALESLVSRATAHDPARRFQRASEVAEAFFQIVQSTTDTTQRGSATSSKMFAIGQFHSQQNRSSLSSTTGTWQIVPPIVTGKLSAVVPTGSHTHVTPSVQQHATVRGAKPDSSSAVPATGEQRISEKPSPLSLQPQSPQGSLDASWHSESASWNAERSWERPPSRKGSKKRVRVKDRRKVLALLATSGGSAVVAFAAVQVLPHVIGAVFGQHTSQMNSTTSGSGMQGMQMQGGTQSNMGNMGNTAHQQTSMPHMGTVIGSSNMMPNSSIDFKNPADNKASLLVRLPNGQFMAYEKACTHEQVSVHYDPATHTLVCPAHGSIFDPARLGAVLQGPATRPLVQVKIRVNADGTITTG